VYAGGSGNCGKGEGGADDTDQVDSLWTRTVGRGDNEVCKFACTGVLGDKVKETLTEVKMSAMCKRAAEANEKKTYQSTDRVTVLGLVCEKMAERVVLPRQEEEDRRPE